jgi:hypothetical protein
MDADMQINEPSEGEWIYVSAPLAHLSGAAELLSERISLTIRSRGWLVLDRDEDEPDTRREARRLEALRSADACVFDVSSPSEIVGAELATAVCSGRPIIALEHEAHPVGGFIAAVLDRSSLGIVIRYSGVEDCVDALSRVLVDQEWCRAVGRAAADAA